MSVNTDEKLYNGRSNSIYKHNEKLLNHKRNNSKNLKELEENSNFSMRNYNNTSMRNIKKPPKKSYYDSTKQSKFSLSMAKLDKELDILTEKLREMSFKKGLTETHEYFENGKTISLQENDENLMFLNNSYLSLNNKKLLRRHEQFICMDKYASIENSFPNLARNNSKLKSPCHNTSKYEVKVPKNYNIKKKEVNLTTFEQVIEQAKKEKSQLLEINKQKKMDRLKNWKRTHRK